MENSPVPTKKEESTYQQPVELMPDLLSRPCEAERLPFQTTDDLPDLVDVIGQPRAFRALELGSEVGGVGYNIFVLGFPDSGRTTLTRDYLQRKAKNEPVPDDWCYANNFDHPHEPLALRLPAGRAADFRADMAVLVSTINREIPMVFDSDEYHQEHDRIVNGLKQAVEGGLRKLEETVRQYNFALIKTPYGLFLGPSVEGKLLKPEEVEKLGKEEREKLGQLQQKLSELVDKALAHTRELEKVAREEIGELDLRSALYVIQPQVDQLREKYAGMAQVLAYLDLVQVDMVKNAGRFRAVGQEVQNPIEAREWAVRYSINLLVDNSGLTSAPVITENQPTYHTLLGSIEHEIAMGVSHTDFAMIRPGALHRANGGYLILPARDVLMNPYAWEGLKRVLRDGEIRILELGSQMGLMSTASLEPAPIPLKAKVIMVGTPLLYYLLRAHDEDFAKLFKVRAEFATDMERNEQSELEYGLFVKSVVLENQIAPFDRSGVARIIEYSSRLAEDQQKLSTRFGIITDVIREAGYWAKKEQREPVDAQAVQRAIDERIYRSNLMEERIQEFIRERILRIDTVGECVGQVNALSVLSLGEFSFGRPSRVTASVSAGQAGVLDIERQAKLGGPIHTKGVLIIGGFLGARYGQKGPLSLNASLTFEQSYDEVDGDSASAAELLALLSAVSGIPLRQSMAITGSIDQCGTIQPIGGVNEKIEGFFHCCEARGLTGDQGVIIPAANRRNLMLDRAVIEACSAGLFHIWPAATIDDAIRLLTGREVGELQADGSYPRGSFNQAVVERLSALARAVEKNGGERRSRRKKGDEPLENEGG